MAALSLQEGVDTEPLTSMMEEITKKVGAMSTEIGGLRDALETRVVALSPYLPLNSKEGMALFFRVSNCNI